MIRLQAPVHPGSRGDARLLGIVLYTATLLRPETLQLLSSVEDKTGFIKELYAAASALSMFRANYSYGLISQELGIPEKTVRRYTRGGDTISKLVSSVLSELESRGGYIEIEIPSVESLKAKINGLEEENKELRKRIQELEAQVSQLRNTVELVKARLKELQETLH